ncbi:MAG: type II toxin-antitoxin system HicB family antitoxin [Dehalococcoidia bacterium]|nr:type II toxin-antitoxin system HicB family antitoxin [Dehalococcoidia bacterium]
MRIRVVIEYDRETGGYAAYCPELPGCTSAGDTEEEALDNIREAITLFLSRPRFARVEAEESLRLKYPSNARKASQAEGRRGCCSSASAWFSPHLTARQSSEMAPFGLRQASDCAISQRKVPSVGHSQEHH